MPGLIQTKSPVRSWLAGRMSRASDGPSTTRRHRDHGHVRVKTIAQGFIRPRVLGDMLPVGATVSDEFATRLGAWLAGVAMNRQGTA